MSTWLSLKIKYFIWIDYIMYLLINEQIYPAVVGTCCNFFFIGLLLPFSALRSFGLTRRWHDIGNSLGEETSCENSIPLTYSTLNVLVPNGQ